VITKDLFNSPELNDQRQQVFREWELSALDRLPRLDGPLVKEALRKMHKDIG
jgi:hypothetical protein